MPKKSNACSVRSTEQVASPGADSPRRVLRSRQGNAGLIVNLGEGSTSFIVTRDRPSDFSITKCKDKRCQTCPKLNIIKFCESNVTKRRCEVINHTNENLTCHSQNVIYLLTCLFCNIQYVGETAMPFHQRNNGHRTAKEGCAHEIRHCKETCNGYNFQYQILEKFPGTGYNSSGELDPAMTELRKKHEDIWMKKLRTIYPYGLNEKASNKETDSSILHPAVGKLFPPLPRHGPRQNRARESRTNHTSQITCENFFQQLDHLLSNNLSISFNEIRKLLNLAKKKVLKEIAFHIIERDIFTFYENRFQWYEYILDIIDTKLLKIPKNIIKKVPPQNVITIKFVNKGLDEIHINSIFHSAEVISSLPQELQQEENIPSCTFKLDVPIRNKILNYQETVASLNVSVDEEVSFVNNLPSCECQNSEFCDPHHKHIVSGDLRIIENSKLRKLLSKGPNYREPKMLNYKKCKSSIESSITSSVEALAKKYNIQEVDLEPWKKKILELVDRRIAQLKSKRVASTPKPVLDDEMVKAALSEIHEKFVIVPIDKASNNVAIVCKRFYIQKLLDEVGVPGNSSSTYQLSDLDPCTVIDNNELLCDKYGITLEERLKTLPLMYWMPKMHYSPPRARFIVASSSCSSKPLSKLASSIYKHIFNQTRNFHEKSTFYSNYNRFWPIESNAPVIEKLLKVNERKKAKDISTYDFSTLYTKLPHDDLIDNLDKVVDFAFQGGKGKKDGNRKYLTVCGRSTFWSKRKKGKNSFTKQQIKILTRHLIKETYFKVGNLLFHQIIGIPMGIDPAPFWANLHLYSYECDFITSLISSDKARAMKYRFATRFIDDECNLNDGGEFGRSFHQIYPKELELKCEHSGTHATFLDLEITIVDGIFVFKLFDKRNEFPFFIVRMPDLSGNIPSHVFYGSVMSEFLRIARSTLLYQDFLPVASNLLKRMVNQGGSEAKLLQQISKAINRYPQPFAKFSKNSSEIVSDLKSE